MPCHHGAKYANASEEELMLWYYGCDENAINELFECRLKKFLPPFLLFKRITKEDIEDIVSEIRLKLLMTKHRPSTRFNPSKGNFRPWLVRIAKNEFINHLRKWYHYHGEVEFPLADEEELPTCSVDVEAPVPSTEGITDVETKVRIRLAVERLGEPSRTILQLWGDDYTLQEISRRLEISLAKVHRILKRDLEKLRRMLVQREI